jgi:hypothetical protein
MWIAALVLLLQHVSQLVIVMVIYGVVFRRYRGRALGEKIMGTVPTKF